jgi:hypothetical protein
LDESHFCDGGMHLRLRRYKPAHRSEFTPPALGHLRLELGLSQQFPPKRRGCSIRGKTTAARQAGACPRRTVIITRREPPLFVTSCSFLHRGNRPNAVTKLRLCVRSPPPTALGNFEGVANLGVRHRRGLRTGDSYFGRQDRHRKRDVEKVRPSLSPLANSVSCVRTQVG